ncbi:MAG: hypothetical protein JNK34_01390 [Tabrizicola sp.]|nr:hypothetical protein [Tabrizicola sp.]
MRDPTHPPRLSRKAASAYLHEKHGLTFAVATLAKMVTEGGGPPYHKPSPRRTLYAVDALDAWAEAKIGPARTSTREAST